MFTSGDAIRAMYEAALAGDTDGFFGYVHDDLELFEPPCLPYGKTYRGKAGFAELFHAATQVLDLPTMTIESVISEGESVAAVISCNLLHTGATATILEQWTVRDGQVIWGRVYWHDPTLATGISA
ncbi:nuclear transport factor 2 family protein [Mycobacterium sp.]|uniref:nuclear transport factor 2 family protein n=1 Tax=Mycobacterium sp. TaxID=1785 RepID=UPI0011F8A17F|nr:nuclear transport factor 2 family protein [Mycobacterium sp.]TAM67307.1 MAG: nuclear transport factor 2 family protein [Mycobacterium sp.]